MVVSRAKKPPKHQRPPDHGAPAFSPLGLAFSPGGVAIDQSNVKPEKNPSDAGHEEVETQVWRVTDLENEIVGH